jgi:hypothetical protein
VSCPAGTTLIASLGACVPVTNTGVCPPGFIPTLNGCLLGREVGGPGSIVAT